MPEMTFEVRWPDGHRTEHYSPSLVMHDYLEEGAAYPVDDFVARTHEALDEASERVREKFGFACTSAMHSQERIAAEAGGFAAGEVTILRMALREARA